MTEATIVPLAKPIMDYIMNGRVSGPRGNRDDIMAPHNCYRCKGDDKWIAIAISTEEEWEGFCQAIGSPKWCQEERFADAVGRYENQDELDKLIEEWTINHASSEVMETLQNAGVPAAPSFNTEELVNDPHLKERGFLIEIDHPEVGKHPVLSLPWKLSPGCSLNYKHAPLLGEHNEYIFHELLGMPKSEVTRLVEERVIW